MAKAAKKPAKGSKAKPDKGPDKLQKRYAPVRITVPKRTSIGSGTPLNKQKRRNWKPYRGQGRPR